MPLISKSLAEARASLSSVASSIRHAVLMHLAPAKEHIFGFTAAKRILILKGYVVRKQSL